MGEHAVGIVLRALEPQLDDRGDPAGAEPHVGDPDDAQPGVALDVLLRDDERRFDRRRGDLRARDLLAVQHRQSAAGDVSRCFWMASSTRNRVSFRTSSASADERISRRAIK